jgi:ankyrin repeat protein
MNIVDVIRTLAGFAWLAAIGLGILAAVRASRHQTAKGSSSSALILIIVATLLTVLGSGLVYVESNERGVVKTVRAGGVRPVALEPGLHWILPIVEQVVNYSISNQTYTMSFLPEQGPDSAEDSIRARTKDGQEVIIDDVWSVNLGTELISAAEKSNFSLVRKILDTQPIEQNELNTAFLAATKKGNAAIIERFLQAGVDVNLRGDDGYTPLMRTARDGREQAVEILLTAGADVNAVSDEDGTALILAAEKDRRNVIALLLAANADVNAQRKDGMTALLLAAQEGHQQTIQILIKANANVNYQLENGATALMLAAQHGYLGAVHALIAAKADLNFRAKNGVTALALAERYRHRETIELLKKSGAK